ncbi:hypothetical protein DK45_4255 [Bordetella bronchiseptica]|nr:hypothetical protein DK45_4255 [Bordetella bronchiseptica]
MFILVYFSYCSFGPAINPAVRSRGNDRGTLRHRERQAFFPSTLQYGHIRCESRRRARRCAGSRPGSYPA